MSTQADTHRVYHFNKGLREAMKRARVESGLRQQDFFKQTIETHLPRIVEELHQLGFQPGGNGPVKIGVSESTLKLLRQATAQTGIPSTALTNSCMILATRDITKPRAKAKPRAKPRAKAEASQT